MDSRRFGNNGIGSKIVKIHVFFGPKFISQATLEVRGQTTGNVTVNPGQVQFGAVPQGQMVAQNLDIQYTGKIPNWAITEVDANNAPVDLLVKPIERARGRVTYRVTATLKKDAPPGLLQEHLFLKTNDPATPILTVSVGGSIQPALAAVQGALQKLDPVPVGETTSWKLMLRGNKDFRILKIDGEANGLTVEYNKGPVPLPVAGGYHQFQANSGGTTASGVDHPNRSKGCHQSDR